MSISVVVPKETDVGERRVALVPDTVARLVKLGLEVMIEQGAGQGAYYTDDEYVAAGAKIISDQASLYDAADIILGVQPPAAALVSQFREGAVFLGFLQPHRSGDLIAAMRDKGVTSFAMELVPRISRAQSMDALSSQASVVGYKAVLIAAEMSNKFFPMLTTAAGTIRPAKVLILGAGVAGLQAIATARRLGAIVEAYDVRRAACEQVESLGAKFLQVELEDAEAEGGYARELNDEEKQREQAMLWRSVGLADVVITTAQIPGRPAPMLVSAAMVEEMRPGSVIVDLAAESGGNCELTVAGQCIDHQGVIINGPANVPSMLAVHSSEMYAKNLLSFLTPLCQKEDGLELDWEDEILTGSVVTHEQVIKHQATRERLEGAQP